MKSFPAHIRFDATGKEDIQTVFEHIKSTAAYASDALAPSGLTNAGKLIGYFHDLGKLTQEYSEYLNKAVRNVPVRRGLVNHTFSGVRLLFERYHNPKNSPMRNMACEILAYAVGAHHGQFDCISEGGQDGFEHRLSANGVAFEEAKTNFFARIAPEELDRMFEAATEELSRVIDLCNKITSSENEMLFYISMISRLLLSALIDADRRDTAEFMLDNKNADFPEDMGAIWQERLAAVSQNLKELPVNCKVDEARKNISEQCGLSPSEASGIYRLTVPTGGGKTLSALRFALSAANRHNKRRIVFVTPLLSVLEQNASAIRNYLDADELVLEHHSNILHINDREDCIDTNELLTESWRSPVIITTFFQLLNTLFDGRTSSIRRMNALIDSVIVIDEIQSLPRHMTTIFNLAVNFLAKVCRTSIVLCSATQPCLERVEHSLYAEPKEIAELDPELLRAFRRTEIQDIRKKPGGYTAEDIAELSSEMLKDKKSVLIICNKKSQAEQIYRRIKDGPAQAFHLSTSMCMAHRTDILNQVKECLNNEPVICVATQMMEAGVDISFGSVIRVLAGLDNVIQAAGRCNRSGEGDVLGQVMIVNMLKEDLAWLKEISQAQVAMQELLASYEKNSDAFGNDLQSVASINYYYKRLFGNMDMEAQDYPVQKYKTTLFSLLSNNDIFRNRCKSSRGRFLGQAFKSAGQAFKVFADNSVDVLVPYGAGEELIVQLASKRASYDLTYRKKLLDHARRFTVSLFSYQVNLLNNYGGLSSICEDAILVAEPAFYDIETGINIEGNTNCFLEV